MTAAAAAAAAAQKQVKWAPGLGQPADIHVALLEPDMAWDDARLARILRTDRYLSVTVSPQLPGLVRSYSCFADLHSQLLLAHPHESGRTGKRPRSLPFLPDWPAQLDRNTSHRLVRGLGTYLQELAGLPAHILHHESVAKFCEPPPVPSVPLPQQPAQLSSSSNGPSSPTLGDQMGSNGRAWSTMSNASNSDPSLPRGRHPNAQPPLRPQRVTSTASSGVSLNVPKHVSGGPRDISSAPVSPVNGAFQQQRNQRGTVFPRGNSMPASPSSPQFPQSPPLPPAPDQRSPVVPSRSGSPRFAPRSTSHSRDPNDFVVPPQRVRSREQSMASSSLSHTSSGSSHSRPPMPPLSPRQQQQQPYLHYHVPPQVLSSPHIPPRGVSSNGDHGGPPPPRRSATSASSSRPPSAFPPPATPNSRPLGAASPSRPPLIDPSTPSVATPCLSTAAQGFGDKTLKIKLVFPKLEHVAAVRIRLDALSIGTLLTAVEAKVDQAHAERTEVQRPQHYTICYRVAEERQGVGRSVKVNQQTWPQIVKEVLGSGEEKVVLYLLY